MLFLCSCESLLEISYSIAWRTQAFVATVSAFHHSSSPFSSQSVSWIWKARLPWSILQLWVELIAALTGNMLRSCEHSLWFSFGDTGSQGETCCLNGCCASFHAKSALLFQPMPLLCTQGLANKNSALTLLPRLALLGRCPSTFSGTVLFILLLMLRVSSLVQLYCTLDSYDLDHRHK